MHMLQRTKNYSGLVLGAIFLLFPFLLSGLAWADGPKSATTKTRLNLRSCPATQDCPVLRTLPREMSLEVLESQGDWAKVRVSTDGKEGWVNSGYITLNPETETGSTSDPIQLLLAWKLPVLFALLAGAILLLAFLMRKLSPEEFRGSPLPVIVASLVLGFTFLLNQFG